VTWSSLWADTIDTKIPVVTTARDEKNGVFVTFGLPITRWGQPRCASGGWIVHRHDLLVRQSAGIVSALAREEANGMTRRRLITAGFAGLLAGCATGQQCSDCLPPKPLTPGYVESADKWLTKSTAHRCAEAALKNYHCQGQKPSKYFEEGFTQAYEDLAFARPARVPAVPPPKYWNAYYRSCAGQPAVDDWFAGYSAGLQSGEAGGVTQFRRVLSSWSGNGGCAPGGGCSSGGGW
jgi:hypothetical protein